MDEEIYKELEKIHTVQSEILYNSKKINEKLQKMRDNILVAHLIIFSIIIIITYLVFWM